MAVLPQITSKILLYLLLCSTIISSTFQGALCDTEPEGPSESECRPYIEKALKQLETGDTAEVAQEDDNLVVTENEDDSNISPIGDVSETDDNEAGSESQEQADQPNSTQEDTESLETDGEQTTNEEDTVEEQTETEKSEEQEISKECDSETGCASDTKTTSDESKEELQVTETGSDENETAEDVQASTESTQESVQEASIEQNSSAEEDVVKETESSEVDAEASETQEVTSTESGNASQEDAIEQEQSDSDKQVSTENDSATEQTSAEDTVASEQDNASAEDATTGEVSQEESQNNASIQESAENTAEQTDDSAQSAEEAAQSVEQTEETTEAQSAEQTDETADAQSVEQTEETPDAQSAEQNEETTETQSTEQTEETAENQSTEQTEETVENQSAEQTAETADAQSTETTEAQSAETAETQSAEQINDSAQSVEQVDESATSVEQTDDSTQSVEQTEEVPQSIEQTDVSAQSQEQTEETAQSTEDATASSEQTDDATQSVEQTEEAVTSVEQTDESVQSAEQSKAGESVEQTEEVAESAEQSATQTDSEAQPESTEEQSEEEPAIVIEDLTFEFDIPTNLRPRDHVTEILQINDASDESELINIKAEDSTLKELKRLYENAIKPLEVLYKYRDLSNRHFGDPEIYSKPLVLFMGPWSGGKSSIINYLLDNEYTDTSLRTGAEPSPAYFNIITHGEHAEVLDGTQLAADWTFSGLQKFGQGLEERLRGLKMPKKLLEKINIVEIPGILEVRKQVSRIFPFNDVCQWFIDRADIIFLVYDPSKLDVGPETEAILDQLKGREYQTRIILNKADQVKPEELMRVQGALIWNISPLMSSAHPPVMYSTSLWSRPYEIGAPIRLLEAQERAFLKDLKNAMDRRVENKIASARRFAVRVRNHAKMVDCYLTTYYNHKSVFGNRKLVSDQIIEHPQEYHIYEGLSTLTNISRYDLPDPDVYRDFFKLNPLYDFQQLSATCTYFRGCPINRLDITIAYDLPELVGKYKKMTENTLDSMKATLKS